MFPAAQARGERAASDEWREMYREYRQAGALIMDQQLKRLKLLHDLKNKKEREDGVTDEQLQTELEQMALEHMRKLPEFRRRELLALTIAPIDVEGKEDK